MKCVVINLADQTSRWAAMAGQFACWPFPVSRFEAIDGRRLSEAEIGAYYSPTRNRRQYHYPLTRGEIGCYASHAAVWRTLLDSNEPGLAVFEDDVTLHRPLREVLHAVKRLNADWGILKLIGRTREKLSHEHEWIPGHRLVRYRRVPSLCSSYVISRNGARQLLSAHTPHGRPVDIDIRHWWDSGCRVVGVQPYPVSLSTFSKRSTIGERSSNGSFFRNIRRMFLQAEYNLKNWQANRRQREEGFPVGRDTRQTSRCHSPDRP